MGERVEQADIIKQRAALLHPPQRIKRGGGKEHREDHEVHHAGKIFQLLDAGGDQHAERAEHQSGQDQRRQHGEIADRRRGDVPEPGDQEEGIDLQQRDRGSRQQFAEQEIPARQRAHQQRAHVAHLAVIDHRQRGLHAVEQLDHRHQSRRDIDLVEDVGLVGRDDGDAEHLAESGGEDEQPHQRPHQRRDKTLALMQEAQRLAPHDAVEAGDVFRQREPVSGLS